MQASQAKVTVEEQRSFGNLSGLSSPLLEKLRDACGLIAPTFNSDLVPPGARLITGTHCTWSYHSLTRSPLCAPKPGTRVQGQLCRCLDQRHQRAVDTGLDV